MCDSGELLGPVSCDGQETNNDDDDADMSPPWPAAPARDADITVPEQDVCDGSYFSAQRHPAGTLRDKLPVTSGDVEEAAMDLDAGDGPNLEDHAQPKHPALHSPSNLYLDDRDGGGSDRGRGEGELGKLTMVESACTLTQHLATAHEQNGIDCDSSNDDGEGVENVEDGVGGGEEVMMEGARNECLYDGDVTLSPGVRGGLEAPDRTMEEEEEEEPIEEDPRVEAETRRHRGPSSPKLQLHADTNHASSLSSSKNLNVDSPSFVVPLSLDIAAAATTTAMTASGQDAAVFKVPESPATACKHNFGGGGGNGGVVGVTARGRKTSLTGISTGSNGSGVSSSSGVSSMTSDTYDAASCGGGVLGAGKTEVTGSTHDLVVQRRVNGSSSSFSLEEEDANDVYSRFLSFFVCQ